MIVNELNMQDVSFLQIKSNKFNFDKMNNIEKKNYLNLYNLYRRWFSEYIIKKLNLKEYDDKLTNSELNYLKISKDNMDVYQYFSSKILNYFYIRNNIYIEQLNSDEKQFLINRFKESNYKFDREAIEFIKSTYKKAIMEDIIGNGKKCIVAFGPNGLKYFAENDSIVIGVRYDELNKNGLSDKEWFALYTKQLIYFNSLRKKMSKDVEKKLDCGVSVISYDDYSVIRRKQKVEKDDHKE